MKGVVFTEFLEMVESNWNAEIADRIIMDSDLESEGAYTAVGTYDHLELVRMVGTLSRVTGIPAADLVTGFGKYLFGRFVNQYPVFFEGMEDSFSFLKRLDNHIHVEVRKLYPDADLPRFDINEHDPGTLVMEYRSERCLSPLAQGLLQACIAHYDEPVDLFVDELDGPGNVRFTLSRQH